LKLKKKNKIQRKIQFLKEMTHSAIVNYWVQYEEPPTWMIECLRLNDLICHLCDRETNDQKLAFRVTENSHPFTFIFRTPTQSTNDANVKSKQRTVAVSKESFHP